MEHRPGVQFAAITDLDVVVDHHVGVDRAAGADLHLGTDHHVGAHMAAHAHHRFRIHHGTGVDAGSLRLAWIQGIERLRKGEPRILQGNPGLAPLAGLLLQGFGFIPFGGQQHSAGTAGIQGCGQRVPRLQEAQLAAAGLVESRGTAQLRIVREAVIEGLGAACCLYLAQVAEQLAEAHGSREHRRGRADRKWITPVQQTG